MDETHARDTRDRSGHRRIVDIPKSAIDRPAWEGVVRSLYAPSRQAGDCPASDEREQYINASMAVHPSARVDQRQAVKQHLSVSKCCADASDRDDPATRRLYEVAAERLRTTRLCQRAGYVRHRLASMARGLVCVWSMNRS